MLCNIGVYKYGCFYQMVNLGSVPTDTEMFFTPTFFNTSHRKEWSVATTTNITTIAACLGSIPVDGTTNTSPVSPAPSSFGYS